MDIRQDPSNPNRAAIRTGPNITAGAWFVFELNNGGEGYTDGAGDGIDNWQPLIPDPDWSATA